MLIIGVIVVFLLVVFYGKSKGAPAPNEMSSSAIKYRIDTELAWMSKYNNLPFGTPKSESLERMYKEKSLYVEELMMELKKREFSLNTSAIEQETETISKKVSELMAQGLSEAEAISETLKEWSKRSN